MKKAIFSTEISLLKTTIERLLRRKASANLTKIIRKTHPADIAMIMRGLNIENQKNLFKLSPTFAYKAAILEELDESFYLKKALPIYQKFLDILGQMIKQ